MERLISSKVPTLLPIPFDFRNWPLEMGHLLMIAISKSFQGEIAQIMIQQIDSTYPDADNSLYVGDERKSWVRWLAQSENHTLIFSPPLQIEELKDDDFQFYLRINHHTPCYFFAGFDKENLFKTTDRTNHRLETKLLRTKREMKYHTARQEIQLKEKSKVELFFGFLGKGNTVSAEGKVRIERKGIQVLVSMVKKDEDEVLPLAIASTLREANYWLPHNTVCHDKEINQNNCTFINSQTHALVSTSATI